MRQNTGQLAFDWEAAGEALPSPSGGSSPSSAPDRTGTLAQDLIEEIVDAENMRRALKRVRANKGSPGVDGRTIDETRDYLREHWPTIREQLLNGTYRPQPVRRVEIAKPGMSGVTSIRT